MPASVVGFVASLETFLDAHKTVLVIARILGSIIYLLGLPGKFVAKVLPIRILGLMGGMLIATVGFAVMVVGIWKGAPILVILTGVVTWLVGGYIWTHYESRNRRSRSFLFMLRKSPWKELNTLGGHIFVLYGLALLVLWVARRNDIWDLIEGAIAIVIGGAIIDHLTHRPKTPASNKKASIAQQTSAQ